MTLSKLLSKYQTKPKRYRIDLIRRLTKNHFEIDEDDVDNLIMVDYIRHTLTDYHKFCGRNAPKEIDFGAVREYVNSKFLCVYPELK